MRTPPFFSQKKNGYKTYEIQGRSEAANGPFAQKKCAAFKQTCGLSDETTEEKGK